MARAQLHGGVDVGGRGDPALDEEHGRRQVGHKQPVDDKARRVDALDRRLIERARELHRPRENLRVGLLGAHDLDELHHLHRVEEVQPDHLRRAAAVASHRPNGQRARV